MYYYKNGVVSKIDLRGIAGQSKTYIVHNLNGPAIQKDGNGYFYIDGDYIGFNLSKDIFDKHVFNYLKRIVFQ